MLSLLANLLATALNTVFGSKKFLYLGNSKTVTEIEVDCRDRIRTALEGVKAVSLTEEEEEGIYELLKELVTEGQRFDHSHRFQKIHESVSSRIKPFTDSAQECPFVVRWDIAALPQSEYYDAVGRINEILDDYFTTSNRHAQGLLAVCIEEQTSRLQKETPGLGLDAAFGTDKEANPASIMMPVGGSVGDA